MSAEREEGGFLGRWSARKRGAEADAPEVEPPAFDVSERSPPASDAPGDGVPFAPAAESTAAPPDPGAVDGDPAATPYAGSDGGSDTVEPNPAGTNAPPEAPLLTDVDMPPVESLDAGSDLSGFFSKGVSAALRRAAFRHVFSQPSYNVRDGLNDYDGDYTAFEPLGDTVTSDMKFHAARHERERLRREAEAEAEGRIEVSSTSESDAGDAEADGAAADELAAERDTSAERDADGTEARDEVASIGADGRSLDGTRPGGNDDTDGEGAGHG